MLIYLLKNSWNICFLIVPFLYIIVMSLYDSQNLICLTHYSNIFQYDIYVLAILNSIYISFISTMICIGLSYLSAYFILSIKNKNLQLFCRTLISTPCWMLFLVRIYGWVYIIDQFEIQYSHYTTIVGCVSCFLPFSILAIQHLMDKIDFNIIEAASDLGSKNKTILFKIIIPLTKHGALSIISIVFIPILGEYFIISILGGGNTLVVGGIIQHAIIHQKFQFLSAYITFLLLLIMPYILIYRRYIK